MREIKFRAKRKEDGKTVFGNLLNYNTIGKVGSGLESYSYSEIMPETVGQYTGLKDKNGKEIYEGDLLEYKNDLGRHNLHRVFRAEGGLVINIHNDDVGKDKIVFYEACADLQTSSWIKQCEVIGNIH